MKSLKFAVATAVLAIVGTVSAADYKPAVVFDMGGKFDKARPIK